MSERAGTRAENFRAVTALRSEGLNGVQIAERLGLSKSYVYTLVHDPTGARDRERKRKYDGVCVDCGGRTVGDGGLPPTRCLACASAHAAASAKWTREAIISAIHDWTERYGAQPRSSDWNAAQLAQIADPERRRRYARGGWPSLQIVQRKFGSWNAAIEAAGLPTLRDGFGGPGSLPPAELDRTITLYRQGASLADIAASAGISRRGVVERLRRAGVYQPRITTVPKRDKGSTMPNALNAERVIEREIERAENRAERLRAELRETETLIERLRLAEAALSGSPNGAGHSAAA